MKVRRAYKVELDPNNKQRTEFMRHAGCARKAYNWGLGRKIEAYELRKHDLEAGIPTKLATKVPTAIDLHKELNLLKKISVEDGGYPWMYESSKSAPQEALRDLDRAFDNFFRRCKANIVGVPKGFPKFKSRRRKIGGFRLGVPSVQNRTIRLPKIGSVRLKESDYLPITGTSGVRALSCSVSERAGRWFVSVPVEQDLATESDIRHLPVLGVDVGVKNLAVLSDGTVFENPKALARGSLRLARLQRVLSRRVKGSANRRKAKCLVARQHYRISCIRQDALHKCSSAITKRCSTVVIEDLNVVGMLKNHKLAKSVSDASMSELHRQISYKAAWRGVSVVTADRWFPSSKTCSRCGKRKAVLSLETRTYVCESCGLVEYRDLNAACNLRNLAVSSTVSACGEAVRPTTKPFGATLQAASVKQEPNTVQGVVLNG